MDLSIEITKVFFVLFRAVPIIILVSVIIILFFSFRTQVEYGIEERYLYDIAKNTMSSQLAVERGVFSASELNMHSAGIYSRVETQPYVKTDEFLYEVTVQRRCRMGEQEKDCKNFCSDICLDLYNNRDVQRVMCPYTDAGLFGDYCGCECKANPDSPTGFWKLGHNIPSAASKEFPVSVRAGGNTYSASMRVDISEMISERQA